MSCNHSNPAGYLFCGSCGAELEVSRCRCGFVAAAGDAFCGRCGASLFAAEMLGRDGAGDADKRFDLENLVQQAAQENKFLDASYKARVTQDEIHKLLATRRKKL